MLQGNEQHLEEFAERMSHLDGDEKAIVLSMFSVDELIDEIKRQNAIKDNQIKTTLRVMGYGGEYDRN